MNLIVDLNNLLEWGNCEVSYKDNYLHIFAKENSGVSSDYFTSNMDVVSVKFRGRTVDAAKTAYGIYSYDEAGNETLIYGENLSLDRDGCFDVCHSFDPVNAGVYKNAEKFRVIIYTVDVKGEIYLNRFSVEEGNDLNVSGDDDELVINNFTLDGVYVTLPGGGKIVVPILPKKVVLVGNSMLLGMGNYGMCATSEKCDYAHHIMESILKNSPNCEFEKLYGSPFESSTTYEDAVKWFFETPNKYSDKPAIESFSNDTDLVIIQLTDNVNTDEKIKVFEKSADMLVNSIKQVSPFARIIWVYGWYNKYNTRDILFDLCKKWSIELVDISDCRSKENEAKSGQISIDKDGKEFVVKDAWITHPGDKGMRAISEKIIRQIGF